MIHIWLIREETGEEFHIRQQTTTKTLLAILQEHRIFMDAICGGRGACAGCRVCFLEGALEPTAKERRLLSEAELEQGIRLACAVTIKADCKIMLPPQEQEKIAVLGQNQMRQKADKIIENQIESKKSAGNQMMQEELSSSYGIAIDIGTTTLAAVLLDIGDGTQKAATSFVNHQRVYGADVISRIFASNDGRAVLLQRSIQSDLKNLIEQLMHQAGIAREQIKKVVIAGNTTMCHLLRGLSCEGLGAAPFVPEDISLWEGTVNELLDTACYQARAIIFPGISAFVGADIVAGIYASGMDLSKKKQMLLDIGTNGEMVLGGKDGLLVTSAAAGPVFEGGNISCGVAGIPGAVTHVTMHHNAAEDPFDIRCSFDTIRNEPPVGLCGTGVIDVMSELVRLSVIDENGNMAEPWFDKGVSIAGDNVVFTQRDVREVQMGKSAIRAGIETLLMEDGADASEIELLLAGGFGYYMDVKKAIRIGLFPSNFDGKVKMIGNSALAGAVKFLTDDEKKARTRLEKIISGAREINLAMHPAFTDLYMQYMFFEGSESSNER